MKVGINGMGRMGRLALRAAFGGVARPLDDPRRDNRLEVIHVNEIKGGAAATAHLLEFDSMHGRWHTSFELDGERGMAVGGTYLGFSAAASPGDVAWGDLGCEMVLECTGKFLKPEQLQAYFDRGVKKVIVAAPVKGEALNIVMGVNDGLYEPAKHRLLTNASCTTNCLAPVVKVMHEGIGIEHGAITTLHDVTNTQTLVDAPHSDLRRARAAGMSLIPTTTGSATAIGMIYPELLGKLNGHAVRVPLLTGSLTDCVFQMQRATTVEEVNALLKAASESGPLKGILGFETRPLVSVDYKGDPRSAIIDALSTMVVNQRMVKIYAWYDNEWGYSNRMAELTRKVAVSL